MVDVEGHNSGQADGEWVVLRRVTPGYFSTLGIPLFTGRDFNRSDSAGAPGAAVISQTMAQKFWPHQSPLGKHIEHVGPRDQAFEVVGVVGDTAGNDLRDTRASVVYLPLAQSYLMFPWEPDVTLLARSSLGTQALTSSLRSAVTAIDPALPLFHVRTFEQQADNAFGQERFLARLLTLFAALALFLSMAGVFGLVAYSTARATRDFGIRIALGAQSYHVLWMVLRRGLALSGVGLALGFAIGAWSSRLLSSLLLGVTPGDPGTLIAIGVLLLLITLLACSLPARRETRVDPVIALRNE
jgi:putative ABC transport system permease protein